MNGPATSNFFLAPPPGEGSKGQILNFNFGGLGVPKGSKKIFFKHGHVACQIDGDEEQMRMQVKFSSEGHIGDLGVRLKVKYH